ncbi:hypothetical protein FocTR4_00013775 [Fusarium oxysporum f. sp. cubense]|uniref:Uncharacterized protein n=3 Tax=Fusarium oxysporum species complex TaxID=171631 RepID=A0A5C6SKX2_FUSOC|nr:hypothetical protein FocTR4_00013775 [Fusarium oxysporum f. sp. cubense]
MDGGRDVQGLRASKVILLGLETIARIHNIKPPFLRAWVVTHWDKDHFQGFLDLLNAKELDRFCLEKSEITPNVTSGVEALGYDFFGQDSKKVDAGFWCVGGDGYSYIKGFKIPPEPQNIENIYNNLVRVSKKGLPRQTSSHSWRRSYGPKEATVNLDSLTSPQVTGTSASSGTIFARKCSKSSQSKLSSWITTAHLASSRGEILEGMDLPQRLIAHGGKLLYTTRLPYWVDESKFGKWLTMDLNINPDTRLNSLLGTGQSSKSGKRLLTGNESQKAVDKALKEAREVADRVDWNKFMKTTLREPDDDDEEDDPSFTYEDGLEALLSDILHNQGTAYDSVYDRVTRELEEAADKGKYEMEEDGVQEKPFKVVDETMENKHDVVDVCVKMWNSISEQQIKEGVAQSKYYLLQLISANDDKLDGAVKAFEWPEDWGWSPNSKT